ncbi:hypothetical protein OG239_05690 [Streptomyces sp. NBC_00868]|uniref:hypothetical protein n=1 Tax=unclassified Streptomyces TaxID=2593676 RepID=UPI003254692B|nr:hypothetical protein OG239_05690 [Streptomyces sp. NBC_00868]
MGTVAALVLAGLLMGPQASAHAAPVRIHAVGAVGAVAQTASGEVLASAAGVQDLAAGTAVSDSKKSGKKSGKKKKSSFFKKFGIAAVVVILLIVLVAVVAIAFVIRRAARRRSEG